MEDQNIYRTQMRKGFIEYCLLLILRTGRAYTSDITQALRDAGMIVVEGTLYTLLNRLRKEDKLTYEWEESPKGPPRKYYTITQSGVETLRGLEESWNEIAGAIDYLKSRGSSHK